MSFHCFRSTFAQQICHRRAWRWSAQATVATALSSLFIFVPPLAHIVDNSGYWVVISSVVVLEATTGASIKKCVQRILGTVVGGLIAWGLFLLVVIDLPEKRPLPPPQELPAYIHYCLWVVAFLIVIPWGLIRSIYPSNTLFGLYGILTGHIVIYSTFSKGGDIQRRALSRILANVLGVIISTVVVHIVLPNSARPQVRKCMAEVLRSLSEVFQPLLEQEIKISKLAAEPTTRKDPSKEEHWSNISKQMTLCSQDLQELKTLILAARSEVTINWSSLLTHLFCCFGGKGRRKVGQGSSPVINRSSTDDYLGALDSLWQLYHLTSSVYFTVYDPRVTPQEESPTMERAESVSSVAGKNKHQKKKTSVDVKDEGFSSPVHSPQTSSSEGYPSPSNSIDSEEAEESVKESKMTSHEDAHSFLTVFWQDAYGPLLTEIAQNTMLALRGMADCLHLSHSSRAVHVPRPLILFSVHSALAANQGAIEECNRLRKQRREMFARIIQVSFNVEMLGIWPEDGIGVDSWKNIMGLDEVEKMKEGWDDFWRVYWEKRDRLSVVCMRLASFNKQLELCCDTIDKLSGQPLEPRSVVFL